MEGTVIRSWPVQDETQLNTALPMGSDRPQTLPMMDAYLPMMTASALATAGRLGLFEALVDGPAQPSALAARLSASIVGIERLADLLIATGYLRRAGTMVENTAETARWFTSSGTIDYSPGLAWTADAWAIMNDLPDAVLRGRPMQLLWDRMSEDPQMGIRFSRYMHAFAEHLSPDLLAAIPIPHGPKRLLDLGGSHGVHSMAFCRRHSDLEAVIVDLASALDGTVDRIRAEGMAHRIEVRAADIRSCDWGDRFDVVLYLSIAHNMSLEDNRKILRHLAAVMRPGGILVIHDYPRDTTPAIFEAAFRLTLLVETGTRTFSLKELTTMLDDAGFAAHRSLVLSPAEKGTLIVARR